MILGDKNRFAIEFELDSKPCGKWLYGKCCFWAEGEMLGEYELGTSLGDVFSEVHMIVKDCGKRQSNWIDCDPGKIFDYLNGVLYAGTYDYDECEIEIPARYDVKIGVDVFGGLKIFLLDCDILISRLIYSRDEGVNVNEVRLVPGEFDSIIKRFYLELSKLNEEAEPHG